MITQELKTKNKSLLTKMFHLQQDEQLLLPPENKVEVIDVIDGSIDIKLFSKSRPFPILKGETYILNLRASGMTVEAKETGTQIRIVKMSPVAIAPLVEDYDEISSGIYYSDTSSKSHSQREYDQHVLELQKVLRGHRITGLSRSANTVMDSFEMIKETKGQITIKEIYLTLGISKSTLEQHFIKETGLTPKQFCRIEKLNHFITSYKEDHNQSLTSLTYSCGYYDQSHVIKDFKHFLNTSPRKYFNTML